MIINYYNIVKHKERPNQNKTTYHMGQPIFNSYHTWQFVDSLVMSTDARCCLRLFSGSDLRIRTVVRDSFQGRIFAAVWDHGFVLYSWSDGCSLKHKRFRAVTESVAWWFSFKLIQWIVRWIAQMKCRLPVGINLRSDMTYRELSEQLFQFGMWPIQLRKLKYAYRITIVELGLFFVFLKNSGGSFFQKRNRFHAGRKKILSFHTNSKLADLTACWRQNADSEDNVFGKPLSAISFHEYV